MDFHNMKRKELQNLCKKHDIPANLSNLEMVEKLSSFFKVEEEEKEKPVRKSKSCLKNSDEMLSENESDDLKKNLKKVRFSPENDVFQLGERSERGFAVENKGGVGRVTRGGRASLMCKTILISPVVMKKRGKRAVQEVEKEDLVVENEGGVSRVTRARASLGKNVVISSPVVMKKRAKRVVQEVEKEEFDVESKGGVSRVTRARALVGEKVLVPSPVVMKKRGKKVVQEDDKGDLVVENRGGASRVTRARAGKQVLIPSPVVMKKRGKKAVQEDKKGDLVVENEGGASRVTRARAGKQVLISSPVVMKKRGKQAVQEDKNGDLVVENIGGASRVTRARAGQQVLISSPVVMKKRGTRAVQEEKKDAKADCGNTQPKMGSRRSTRNVNISEESEGLMDETDQKVSRKNLRQSTRPRAGAKSNSEDVDKKTVAVEISQPEVVTRQSKRNRQSTDESTRYQTRHGTKRMSVMPQVKKAKTEKPVAGNLGQKNVVVKDSPNEPMKPIVVENGSETGHIRRSKRNASGDGSHVISEDSNGSGSYIKSVTPKKRRRDAVLEEVPSQHTGRRVNRKAGNILDKPKEETPVASEPQTRTGNRQASLMHSASTSGEKASTHHTRELSTVPKRSENGSRQSKTVAVTPRTRSGSGQKSFIHMTKKLRMSGNSGLHKTIGDKESPHQSREISMLQRCSETESKGRGSKSKQTPVIHEHSRRFTRSALKGKTDGPAYVRGKIYQKKSQSVSKLPLSKVKSSLVNATSERPLDIDVQSSYHDRSTVNLVSNTSDLPEDKIACSTPQDGSAKTSSVDLYMQESERPEMINIHEVSPVPLNLQSDHAELEVDISTPQGGSPKTSSVDFNVQESDPPSDPLNLQSNHAEIEVDISTPEGGSSKTNNVNLNGHESEVPELIDIREASPPAPLNLQNNHAELEVDISTPQSSSPKTCSVDLNVQESEGRKLINLREASPGDPLNVQSNHAELEVDISTTQRGSPKKTSSVDLNVQESEGYELINIQEASPGDPLNVQSNHAELEVDISTPQRGSPKTSSVDLNVQESEGYELINIQEASPGDPLNVQSNHAELKVDISTPQSGSPKTSSVDLNVQESEGYELINIREASPGDPLNVQSNHAELEVDISTPQSSSPKTSSVDLNVQESEGYELINIREASPGDPLNVQSNHAELEVDISTPQSGSPKTSSVDLNVQESEGPELINMREASPSDALDLQSNHAVHGDVNKDNATGTQREISCETNVASPHLVHLKADAAAGDVFPADTNALTDISLVDQSTSTRTEERPELSNEVESISKGIDLNLVFHGPAINEDEPVSKSPLPEAAEIAAVTGKSDAACVSQQECPTEISAKSPHLKSADNVDITGDAGSIDADSVDDYHLHVELINSSAFKEKQEVSKKVNHDAAERSTVNEEKSTAEVGDSGPAEQEHDICKHPAEFAESDRVDEDSRSASKEVGGVSFADIFYQTLSTNFTEDKDDTLHPDISGRADEPHNTCSKSGMQEKEFPVPNSIANAEEVSIVEYEFSKPEFSDTVTSTVMCSNKELEELSNQRLSAVESCLMLEESCTNICIEFSTSNVVADSVAGENNKSEPKAPSSPLRATEFDNIVLEVNEELKPEVSPLSWNSDISERAAVDGSSLQKERSCAKSADVSERNQSKNVKVESENRNEVGAFISLTREMSDMPEFISSSPSHVTELGHLVGEVKELKPKDLSSLWSTENVPRTAEDGNSLYNQGEEHIAVGIEGREVETVYEDTVENDSQRTLSMYGNAHHILDKLPMERKWVSEETVCFISGDVEERRMNKNISKERTPVISEDDVDRDYISCPVNVHKFPSNLDDHCNTPSEDSCGKEQGTDMSMVKSSKNFGKEFSSQHDYCHGSLDSCAKEQGTPMSMVKSSKNCGEEFSSQHDKISEQVKVCSAGALPQTICEDFAGFDNEVVTDLMGSTIKRISRTGDLNNEKLEETEPCTVIPDKIVLEDGIESLKRNSSDLVRNLVEDNGGYCEKSAAEIMTCDVSEENRYSKDTIDSHRFDDSLQQFDMNYGEIDSNLKGKCQENDERPYGVQMDVDINDVESSRDNLIAGDTIHRFDQEADASEVPTEEHERYEDAVDADVPANLPYGGESVTLTGETNEAQGVPAEELPIIEDAMDADAPANLQYGRESLTISLQQFDMNYGEIDSNLKGKCQENDERPYGVQMDVDINDVESSRDNLIAGDTIHRFDQEADASEVPTEEHERYEDAVDADVPANLPYGGESVTLTGETNEAQGVPAEELPIIEDAMDADAPANLQYGRESLTITGETNQAQEEISYSDIFGPELKSRSDEVDGEESCLWSSFMLDKSEDSGKELDIFMVSPMKEQLQNSGEKHAREKGPESIANQHAAFNNPSTGDDNVSAENSIGTLNESHLESEANKNAHQKVDWYNSNKSDEDFTRTVS
ncbi:hypothetical protein POM88_037426 [Heracleum sosnowskyi]|uniref:Uncharacterized protein n=1 Tax=Heracleum sosnowskyi TaxID=360622 RepID=A0AAD8HQ48_9APIA|nr:hypothetical protein POM88_037426 [Heracleum sosnowskyi]